MIVAIVVSSVLVFGALTMLRSRASRARARAQLIADYASALARARLVDTNVICLEAYRARRLAARDGQVAPQSQPQHATR